jgi:hypothetical protein
MPTIPEAASPFRYLLKSLQIARARGLLHVPFDVNARESRGSCAQAVSTFPVTVICLFCRCSQDVTHSSIYLAILSTMRPPSYHMRLTRETGQIRRKISNESADLWPEFQVSAGTGFETFGDLANQICSPRARLEVIPDCKLMATGLLGEIRYVVRTSRPTPVGFEEKSSLLKRCCKAFNAQLKRIGAKFQLVGIFS